MRAEDLTKSLDHAVVAAGVTHADVVAACERVREAHVAALRTLPGAIEAAAELLRGCDVTTTAVIDHPGGLSATADRATAAERAVLAGADEIDVVINHRAMRAGDYGTVRDDLVRIVHAVRGRASNSGRGTVMLAVTLEAPQLGEKLTRLACMIAAEVGVDFATSATGHAGPTTPLLIETMRDALPESVAVRAAGGVDTLDDVRLLVGSGAARVASPDAVGLLEQLARENAEGK